MGEMVKEPLDASAAADSRLPRADTRTAGIPTRSLAQGAAKRLKVFFGPATVIYLFLWFLLLAAGRSQMLRDPGAFWHPVVGQRILASGQLIYTDPFSFTRQGQPWLAQWWLGECLLAVLHALGELDSILLATVTLLAALYAWIAARLMTHGLHPLLAALVTALACLAGCYHFHPRPHALTIALMAWTFAQLCDFESGRIGLRRLFWLIPVTVVWSNVHGGVVGGIATLAVAVCGWSCAWLAASSLGWWLELP